MDNYPITNGTMTEAEAEKQAEKINEIMAETGLPFGPAVNVYIEESRREK